MKSLWKALSLKTLMTIQERGGHITHTGKFHVGFLLLVIVWDLCFVPIARDESTAALTNDDFSRKSCLTKDTFCAVKYEALGAQVQHHPRVWLTETTGRNSAQILGSNSALGIHVLLRKDQRH